MLLHRKSLAFVAPSGEKYLIFMLFRVRKWTVISCAKNYLQRQNKLQWPSRTALAFGRPADTIKDRDAGEQCLQGLAPPYLAELCQPVVHLTGRRHLRLISLKTCAKFTYNPLLQKLHQLDQWSGQMTYRHADQSLVDAAAILAWCK